MICDVQIIIAGGTCTIDHVESFIDKVHQFSEDNHLILQVFDADKIYGAIHLFSAAHHALRSEKEKRMTTNSIEMELLLYASGERQLKLAIPKIGIKKGYNNVGVLFILRSNEKKDEKKLINNFFSMVNITRDDTILTGDENTLQLFGISDDEKRTVTKKNYGALILEKIALIDIIK